MFAIVEKEVETNEVTDVILCNTFQEYAGYLKERFQLSQKEATRIAKKDLAWLLSEDDYETWRECTEEREGEAFFELCRVDDVTDKRVEVRKL